MAYYTCIFLLGLILLYLLFNWDQITPTRRAVGIALAILNLLAAIFTL